MATSKDIQSGVWGLSKNGYGYIAQGLALIRQRIDIALNTTRGSDPLRPLFGSIIYLFIDKPVLIAAAAIRSEIYRCIETWVTDVTIRFVTYSIDDSHITFNIGYNLTNTEVTDNIEYQYNNGVLVTKQSTLTLQAFIPANSNNYQYNLSLVLNNTAANPQPPVNGFASIDLLYAWVKTNWSFLATWLLQPEQLIGYLKDAAYKTGKLSIGILQVIKVFAAIPALNAGEKWIVRFKPTPASENILADNPFYTMGEIVAGMTAQFGQYGSWQLENINGDFNADFSGDFNVAGTKLVLFTTLYKDAVITISKS